jgi:hypothetical protein
MKWRYSASMGLIAIAGASVTGCGQADTVGPLSKTPPTVAKPRSKPLAPLHKVVLKPISSFALAAIDPRKSKSPYSGFITADQLPDGTFVSLKDTYTADNVVHLVVHRPGQDIQEFKINNVGRYSWRFSISVSNANEVILADAASGTAWSIDLATGKATSLFTNPGLERVIRTKSGMLAGAGSKSVFLVDNKGKIIWRQELVQKDGRWIPPAPAAGIGVTPDGDFTAVFTQPASAVSYDKLGKIVRQVNLEPNEYLGGHVSIDKSGIWCAYGDTVLHFGLDGKKMGESHPHFPNGQFAQVENAMYFGTDEKGACQLSDGYAVYKFDDKGNHLATLGTPAAVNTVYRPTDFAILPDERLIVLDGRTDLIYLFSKDGSSLGLFTDALAKTSGGLQWEIMVGANSRVFAEGGVHEADDRTLITFDGTGKEINRTKFPSSTDGGALIHYIEPPDHRIRYRDAFGNQGAVLLDPEGEPIKEIEHYNLSHTGAFALYGYQGIYLMDADGTCLARISVDGPIRNIAFDGNTALVLTMGSGITAFDRGGSKLWRAPRQIGDKGPYWERVQLNAKGTRFAVLDDDQRITWYEMPE